jgi:hypothetical protein
MDMNIKDPEVHAMARELLERFSRLPWPEGVTSKELQDSLYDERGLPV